MRLRPVQEPVKRRNYDPSRRRAAAVERRRAIIEAASRLFIENGYVATTMASIAEAAGVNVDTVYAAVGTKPQLFGLLIDAAISGQGDAVPVLQRDYIIELSAEPHPARKLDLYATAVTEFQARLAPLFRVLQGAAAAEPEITAAWEAIRERRARNMPLLIENLEPTGGLRPELGRSEASDTVWALNSTEVYVLLVSTRGWSPERYREWLSVSLRRLLLREEAFELPR
jgi:AcrR family transcriptional regulator